MRLPGLLCGLLLCVAPLVAQGTKADYERAASLSRTFQDKAFLLKIEPHWFADNSGFWYRNELPAAKKQYVRVDALKGERRLAFDHAKLAKSLSMALKREIAADRLDLAKLEFRDKEILFFTGYGKSWLWNGPADALEEARATATQKPEKTFPVQKRRSSADSPDLKWSATIKAGNVVIRNLETNEEVKLSNEGTAADGYIPEFYWSPDSTRLVVIRLRKAEEHKVYLIESSPKDQLQPKLQTLNYLKPGDRIDWRKPHLFSIAGKKEIPVADELFSNPWDLHSLHWDKDSSRFTFFYNQRGHQTLRILAVAANGKVSAIIDEVSKTFVDYAGKFWFRYEETPSEMYWMSERSGWNHLYNIDAKTGKVKNPITKGEWVVRGVDSFDAPSGEFLLRISGMDPQQNPYFIHYCRVKTDGTGFVRLTEGDGTHTLQFSPDRKFFIDTWSRVDQAPVHELRSFDTWKKIVDLEKADISELPKSGWQVPERFSAKGRDGKTDIHGVIFRPSNFDATKKYPVIEQIYAGPHDSFVPQRFAAWHYPQHIGELGFIMVQIDGMGTSNRSKAFHDVCWKNLGDSGFPDRILWLREAAKKYPYLDLDRVGIYGGSAGGQSSTRAVLAFGDFYKVAVSDCGCHDNRMDKIWWNELWMCWPIGPHYAEQSNVTNAHRLKGKLLLTVGELDKNVDPTSTMQVVNALIKANCDFDMLVVPGAGHGIGNGAYAARRRQDYFVRHLLGVEPRRE